MKKFIILILALAFAGLSTISVFAESEKGGYAGAFLNYDLSARAYGMGGAYTGVAEGAAGIRYNPAGITGLKHIHAAFTYSKLTWDRKLNYAEVIFPLPKDAVIGLSWINAGVSDVKQRNSHGEIVGDLENNQNSFNITFGRRVMKQMAVGVNVRYVQYNFSEIMTSTIGIDFGVMGYFLDNNLMAGAKVSNFSSKYAWDTGDYYQTSGTTYDEEFPKIYRFGAAYKFLEKAFTVAADFEKNQEDDATLRLGGEYWLYKDDVESYRDDYTDELMTRPVSRKFISGRLGYNDGRFAIGAGVRHKIDRIILKLDYGFATGAIDGLSPDHLITFGLGYQ
ncbi:MAG: hypothetical protein GY855_07700 [candidate division Zixibacteria bacterium]|nr:hypothetical protein [candidate division Zixibacteria bacterium]